MDASSVGDTKDFLTSAIRRNTSLQDVVYVESQGEVDVKDGSQDLGALLYT